MHCVEFSGAICIELPLPFLPIYHLFALSSQHALNICISLATLDSFCLYLCII